MSFENRYTAVIPAAGIGSRMQSDIPKQYLSIAGKTLLEHSVNAFLQHPLIENVIVVINPRDEIAKTLFTNNVHLINGGEERADSVLAGVEYAERTLGSEWALVHDAARPGINKALIDNLILNVKDTEGGILALPAIDTVKAAYCNTVSSEQENTATVTAIDKTLDRNNIWLAQTPQMFKASALRQALESALSNHLHITDEASAMELQGIEIRLVEGSAENFKVTKPKDLALANFYMSQVNNQKGTNICE